MGRSKFPGKPSKTINRKRISVLQLEDDPASTTTTTDPEDGLSAASTRVGGHKRGNCDDDDENEKGGGGAGSGNGGVSSSTGGGSTTNDNGSSGTRNGDGRNENVNGNTNNNNSGGDGAGANNGAAGDTSNSNTSAPINASKCKASSTNLTKAVDSATKAKSDETTTENNICTTDSEKIETNATDDNQDTNSDITEEGKSDVAVSKNEEKENKNENDAQERNVTACEEQDEDNEDVVADGGGSDGIIDDGEDEDDNADEDDDDNASSTSRKSLQSICSAVSSSTASSAASTFSRSKRDGKFKNLNLAKPEVMLPSSGKLRQLQQQQDQLNCPSPTPTSMNVICAANPFAVTDTDDDASMSTAVDGNDNSSPAKSSNTEMSTEGNQKSSDHSTGSSESSSAKAESKTLSMTSAAINSCSSNSSSIGSGIGGSCSSKQKKTVTFKNILETSDDKSAVKKFYNPDNRIPLVSIIKKESMNRPPLDSYNCIVRPSRLTEIVKNNSNIDKLNSLKFRSSTTNLAGAMTSPPTLSSVFGSAMSCAFGAPAYEQEQKHETVSFRLNETNHLNGYINETKKEYTTENAEDDGNEGEDPNSLDEDDDDDEQQIVVDKHFVLPKRSTRSSRVIKPNKRLLEDGIICKKVSSVKAKQPSTMATNSSSTGNQKKDQPNYFSMGGYPECTSNSDNLSSASLSLKFNKDAAIATDFKHSFSSPFSKNFAPVKSNSFVLRQPLLSVPLSKPSTQSMSLKPLSGNSASSSFGVNSPSNVLNKSGLVAPILCSVCSTPIQFNNLQQPRKYGVPACSACRKFVSKIVKHTLSSSLKNQQLHCRGNGNCAMQPLAKVHIKNFKKIFKERCPSCWLKKCIQTLQLSPGDKLRLNSVLPIPILKPIEAKHEKDITDNDNESTLRKDVEVGGLSPTGLFGTPRFKWNSALETANENLKLNLKSNPLAENNTTFGSSTLLRPAILEKSLFIKTPIDVQPIQQDKVEKTVLTISSKTIETEQEPSNESCIQKPLKSKRKEKHEKEKHKEKEKERNKDKERERDTHHTKSGTSPKLSAAIDSNTATSVSATKSEANETKSSKITSVSQFPAAAIPCASTSSNANSVVANNTVASSSITTTATVTINTSPTNTTSATMAVNVSGEAVKRQRIDLKGPRVKHVCRSASIVLGQPLATFGDEDEALTIEVENDSSTKSDEDTVIGKSNEDTQVKETEIVIEGDENRSVCEQPDKEPSLPTKLEDDPLLSEKEIPNRESIEPAPKAAKIDLNTQSDKKEENNTVGDTAEKSLPLQPLKAVTRNANTSNISSQVKRSCGYATTFGKKYIRQINVDAITQSQPTQVRRKEPIRTKPLISIDFWENYDPAEVCQTGFGLIITERVAQRALCFLCGSAGVDPLIFCACCCEPYHQYCIMDEYNLKHSSLDETMISFLDNSTLAQNATTDNFNHITNRLNWLCPRCTVCYTCNMSSGSKVKCQKCQKNYHSTCLGTSKRLLGADRPLICVNCLKCKSCSTTKVSKFVGNLPMCTSCFKLRKKGNYCPICQKCYDDNDFDLKMMECGDCKQWVHSKCEGLSDEQYNLLSTLPESIEFICKKCARHNETSKQRASEWRQAVMEEFKTSLLSVLKLLSKSRQACALLKLSPRKKMQCICGAAQNGIGKIQPKSLHFNGDVERDPLGSEEESQCSDDVYEFKEKLFDDKMKEKCTCMTKNGANIATTNSFYNSTMLNNMSLVDIKKKINCNDYVSLAEFNYDMSNIIQNANCDELVIAYKEILSEQFPWFQNETKACTDALEEDMFESCSYAMSNSMDAQDDFVNEQQNRSVIDLPNDIDDVIYSIKSREDMRICLFCRKTGEGMSNEESRLLYCGHDCWVHTNCALWSAEVFEEIDGSLQNVHSAISRGRMIKCTVCGNRGATVGCNVKACGEHYHYPCARRIDCAFLTDKTIYCPEHAKSALKGNTNVTIETNFEVTRPVYVELDRKRKKLVEPTKVQFHIGSLEVRQLGTVIPRFSDYCEAIVPINFLCSRLYWSFKEPWKIVEYTVRTTVQNNFSTLTAFDKGRNFTIDHSNPNVAMVQRGLAQIALWHSSLARGELMELEATELANKRNSTLTKLIPEYMLYSQNSLSAPDDNTEEEPQTNADLLPPEVKEAIFEDLPHELLDGISMLDIFPKFMIYEEMGNSDGKTEMYSNEQSKDEAAGTPAPSATSSTTSNGASNVQVSDEDTANCSFSKQLELSNSWSSSNLNISHVEDALLSCSRGSTQVKRAISTTELQRTKADMLKKSTQQRVWAKLDGATNVATAAAIKKRKLSKGLPDLRMAESVLYSLSQQRTKKESAALVAASRRQSICNESENANTLRTKTFTWSAAKHYIGANGSEDKNDTKIKLMQVDGVDDSITEYRIITSDTQFSGTVKCERCHCTYRTYDSFQRHLATCEQMSTSESESEATARSPDTLNGSPPLANLDGSDLNKLGQAQRTATLTSNVNNLPFIQAISQAIPIGSIQANLNGIPITNMSTNLQGVQGLQNIHSLQNLSGLQNIQLQSLQPQALGGSFFISPANPTTSTTDEVQLLNSLQGLTANLNGTYTLAPTTGFGTNTVQAASQQPQLIAVSSAPDGTPQIIQIPTSAQSMASQPLLQSINGFQTLQATNSDKKIVLPVSGKAMKTVATKVSQQATNAAKNKLKASNAAVKPIQSKMNTVTVTQPNLQATQSANPITVLNTGSANATQFLNQNLLQQMQAAGLATGSQQPQLLFQTTNAAGQNQPIVMQQLNAPNHTVPQNIISFVTTDGSQTPQVQYMTIPTSNEFKPQTQASPFITTAPNANQILQGAFLQTDASGNLMLTTTPAPSGLQMLSATPLNIATASQPQPQVIGTLIQPQALQLGGNVIATTSDPQQQPQVIIGSGTTGLEMIAAANASTPQVILATQPMYYGLETIVQNTVMSSQQFVSTAMPGVLSQNASFSATTTQVFQASKIEPIVDIPTGYVVLNNLEAGPSIVQQQTTGAQQPNFLNTATVLQQQPTQTTTQNLQQASDTSSMEQQPIFRLQTTDGGASYQFHPQQQPTQIIGTTAISQPQQNNVQIITAKVPPVTQVKRNNTAKASSIAAVTKVQPQQVVNKVNPTSIVLQQQQQKTVNNKVQQQQQTQQLNTLQRNVNTAAPVESQNKPMLYPNTTTANTNANNFIKASVKPAGVVLVSSNEPPAPLYSSTVNSTNVTTLTTTTKPLTTTNVSTATVRKTNMIRPINKAEVKPKVMKASAVAKEQPTQPQLVQQQPQQTQQQPKQQQMKMAMLKPQPTQLQDATPQVQQYQTEPQQMLNLNMENNGNNSCKLLEFEPMLQDNYADAEETPQSQQRQHQYHNTNNIYPNEAHEDQLNNGNISNPFDCSHQQQQQDVEYESQQQVQFHLENEDAAAQHTMNDTFQQQQEASNMLSVVHGNHNNNNMMNTNRCLQYSNSSYNINVPTNIVNPMQQTLQYNTTMATQQHGSNNPTLISRPTNRVLPMQQRQEHAVPSPATTKASTCIPKLPENNIGTKCFEGEGAKIFFDVEVKKDEQMMQLLNAPHQASQQVMQMQMHEQQQETTSIVKSLSPDNYISDPLKCDLEIIETETSLTTTCQQLQEMVDKNLPRYTGTCLVANQKEKELSDTPEHEYITDVIDAENSNETMDDCEIGDDDEVEDEDDDDGFSLKMPTEDGEHDISDTDEPAVKEKISKILDNLTNEDCADSIATATTAEATNAEHNNVNYLNVAQIENTMSTVAVNEAVTDKFQNNMAMERGYVNVMPEETAAVAAAASQYITQMTENITIEVMDSSFEIQKLQAKLSPAVTPDAVNMDAAAEDTISSTAATPGASSHSEIPTHRPTPPNPQPPQRDPKKISGPHLLYEIQSEDGFTYKSTSIADVWEKVFEAVQVARRAHGLAPLPEGPLADMSGVQMIGLKTNALKYLIEQLPGVERCNKYTPKYHKRTMVNSGNASSITTVNCAPTSVINTCINGDANSTLDYISDQDDLQETLYESVRCEPYTTRSEYDMFSWLASRHRKQPIQVFVQPPDTELIPRRGTGSNLPMAMKYRTLKETYKDYVGVFRSHIHGRGLYCTKDIESGEMVIEYAGELIRSTLTDKRERNYNSRGIGCYMFKIDDNLVVDATMRGNAARFINHSCEPNCYSKVVDILGHKHIIIFALRRIVQGEELTYDYKFPFEDEKIPCSCGSRKCRKYLN